MRTHFWFFLFFLPVACTEPIDLWNDGMEPKLVITCILTDSVINSYGGDFYINRNQVVISKTTPFFDTVFNIQTVDNATVWLDSELLIKGPPGFYLTEDDFCAIPGKTYTLEVHCDVNGDGKEEIFTAVTTVPPKYKLDSLTLSPLPLIRDYMALINLHFDDPWDHRYFGAKLTNEDDGSCYSDRILRYSLIRLNAFLSDDKYRSVPVTDWIIRHEMPHNNKEKYFVFAGDTLSVEFEALSKEYWQFLEAAKTELSPNNPMFSGPRSNVPTNIKGGAIGIFGSFTSSRAVIQIPPDTPGMPKRMD
ncbi:MAG: DUF4249 domain-containing protein [Prevotellaceae bacterium]|jgi:hypothetical protein|nr:DUF4249 domain-containing protein [Prevotellaceae bacterium]